jgi:ATP synthase F1 delta subunit
MTAAGEIDLVMDQKKDTAHKKAFIQKIVSNVESPDLRDFLHAKIAADELAFFREYILEAFLKDLQKKAETITIIRVSVALDFKPEDYKKMVEQVSAQLNRPVALEMTVDKKLIGGAIVQHGSTIHDFTIKSRLDLLSERWKTAVVEA